MPRAFTDFADNEGTLNQKEILVDRKTEYYILNFNASDLCRDRLAEYGDRSCMARINMVSHTFLYPNIKLGETVQENNLACLYTSTYNVEQDMP